MRETMNNCKNVKVRKKNLTLWKNEMRKNEKWKYEKMWKKKNKYWWTDWLTDCEKMKNCEKYKL